MTRGLRGPAGTSQGGSQHHPPPPADLRLGSPGGRGRARRTAGGAGRPGSPGPGQVPAAAAPLPRACFENSRGSDLPALRPVLFPLICLTLPLIADLHFRRERCGLVPGLPAARRGRGGSLAPHVAPRGWLPARLGVPGALRTAPGRPPWSARGGDAVGGICPHLALNLPPDPPSLPPCLPVPEPSSWSLGPSSVPLSCPSRIRVPFRSPQAGWLARRGAALKLDPTSAGPGGCVWF